MNDLEQYISKRKTKNQEFAKNFDNGYEEFKIGEILKQTRKELGYTQEYVAKKLKQKNHLYQELKITLLISSYPLCKTLLKQLAES
jgi:HTH-type transcriptional regulator/antitoxin HipB